MNSFPGWLRKVLLAVGAIAAGSAAGCTLGFTSGLQMMNLWKDDYQGTVLLVIWIGGTLLGMIGAGLLVWRELWEK